MAVIETASENPFPQLSTSIVYLLRFPSENADKQAFSYGSLYSVMQFKATVAFTFTTDRHPNSVRGTTEQDGLH